MKVLIVAVGSRGDVAPLAGLGTALRAAGHSVTVTAYRRFADLVTASGLEFTALPGDPRMLGASEQGQKWQHGGSGPLGTARFVRLVADHMRDVHAGILAAARQGSDVLLVAGQAMFGGYRVAEGLGLPSIGLALQPLHPAGAFPPPAVTTHSLGRRGNRALASAVLTMGGNALGRPSKRLWAEQGLPEFGMRAMLRRQDAARWPVFYGFSAAVVPRPADWREGLEVAGYWWPPRPAAWTPPAALEDFLNAGPPPVFIGFGSSNPDDADRVNRLLADAQRQAGVRMVIQAGWASLDAARQASDDVIVIDEVPHDWLFPQMAAVVHHAGAGTAAAGLRAGVPAVSVPLVIDQPFWAGRLTACGVGPPPIPYQQLSAQALAAAINDAVTRESYREQAQAMARRLASEDSTSRIIKALEHLPLR